MNKQKVLAVSGRAVYFLLGAVVAVFVMVQ